MFKVRQQEWPDRPAGHAARDRLGRGQVHYITVQNSTVQ